MSVDRATGTVTSITLPDVAFEGSNGNGLPTPPSATYAEDYSDIDALALAPDGSIVVARQYATELQLVDPSSGAVTSLPLPPGTELASLGSGDVAGLGADGSRRRSTPAKESMSSVSMPLAVGPSHSRRARRTRYL